MMLRVIILSAVLICCWSSNLHAGANLFGFLGGNEAFDRVQESIDRARDAALAVEAQFNKDGKERLEQVDKIVKDALSEFSKMEKATIEDVNKTADKYVKLFTAERDAIFRLMSQLIFQAECAARSVTEESIGETLNKIRILVSSSKITVYPPALSFTERSCLIDSWSIWCGPYSKTFERKYPFSETYRDIQKYLADRTTKSANDATSIWSLVETYGFLGDVARRTACVQPTTKEQYYRDFEAYQAKVRMWTRVISEL